MPEEFECKSNPSFHPNTPSKGLILLVEDEDFVREVAREILQIEGYTVIEACNPNEALERYEHGGPIDLLLTDIVMPGMDGHDLAVRLTQRQPSIRSIFMSGYTENTLLRRGIRNLNAAYLQKPFTLQALVEKVREVLAEARIQVGILRSEPFIEPNDVPL